MVSTRPSFAAHPLSDEEARLASRLLFFAKLSPCGRLLLLLALGMGLFAFFAGILGKLLGVGRMFFAFGVVVLAVLFRGGAMRFGSILVLFSCLIVCVSRHEKYSGCV
jgi:hypothetical protein